MVPRPKCSQAASFIFVHLSESLDCALQNPGTQNKPKNKPRAGYASNLKST
jgi:hypothetical protein